MLFGKLQNIDGNLTLVLAPDQLVVDGKPIDNPTKHDYLLAGYKEVVNDPPTDVKAGYIAMQTGYDETDDQLIATYQIVKIQSHARKFSKYKIITHTMKIGLWPQIKSFIEEQGLYDLFLAAQDFSEDDAFFKQGIKLIKQKFGLTHEYINQILDECVI